MENEKPGMSDICVGLAAGVSWLIQLAVLGIAGGFTWIHWAFRAGKIADDGLGVGMSMLFAAGLAALLLVVQAALAAAQMLASLPRNLSGKPPVWGRWYTWGPHVTGMLLILPEALGLFGGLA